MKKIIVTGCNGQLGRAINAQYAGSTEYELVNTDVEDLDITDVEAVLAHVREVKPYAIFFCFAFIYCSVSCTVNNCVWFHFFCKCHNCIYIGNI